MIITADEYSKLIFINFLANRLITVMCRSASIQDAILSSTPTLNFFIIGAPRCGTTSLADHLSWHRNVFLPSLKEPKFYCTDLTHRVVKTYSEYISLFGPIEPQHQIIGEASTSYAYSENAIPNIVNDWPNAKFIFMVRNPVDASISLHKHLYSLGVEDEKNFQDAWVLQNRRKSGYNIPSACNDPKRLLYGEIYQYGNQLERLYDIVSSNQVMVINFHDFVAKPQVLYEDVISFLDLPSDGRTNFPKRNSSSDIRSWHYVRSLRTASEIRKALRLPPLRIGERLQRLNRKNSRHDKNNQKISNEIAQFFADDIRKLEFLTGMNLEKWRI